MEGRSDPSFEGLAKIAEATHISLDWLANGTRQQAMDFEIERQILQREIDRVRAVQLSASASGADKDRAWEQEKDLYKELEELDAEAESVGAVYRSGVGRSDRRRGPHTAEEIGAEEAGKEWLGSGDIVAVPLLSSRIEDGDRPLPERLTQAGICPFPRKLLTDLLGREGVADAFAIAIIGDSMAPEFREGDLVLVDTQSNAPADAVVALAFHGTLTVKRLRHTFDGLEIVSVNAQYYPPLHLSAEQAGRLEVLGRVCWHGRAVRG